MLDDGKWHRVNGCYEDGGLTVCVDGEPQAFSPEAMDFDGDKDFVEVSSPLFTDTNNVCSWFRTLTEKEVETLYECGGDCIAAGIPCINHSVAASKDEAARLHESEKDQLPCP